MKYNRIAVILFVIFILVAHLVVSLKAPALYDWRRNTISDLEAQAYTYAWIMRLGLILFGSILVAGIVLKFVRRAAVWHVDIPIFLYAASVLLTGVFSIKPFLPVESYSRPEDTLHSFFATLSGVSISVGILGHAFPFRDRSRRIIVIDFAVFALVVGLSALFGLAESTLPNYVGLVQRLMWLIGLAWLALVYDSK